jgi:hypothetical protein
MLSSYPATGNQLSSMELYFDLKDLQSYTESRKAGLAEKSISWLETSSDIIWEILKGVISKERVDFLVHY